MTKVRLSSRTLTALRRNRKVEDPALYALVEAVERIRSAEAESAANEAEAYIRLQEKRAELGSDLALAGFLGVSRSYVTRLLKGERPPTRSLKAKLGESNDRF